PHHAVSQLRANVLMRAVLNCHRDGIGEQCNTWVAISPFLPWLAGQGGPIARNREGIVWWIESAPKLTLPAGLVRVRDARHGRVFQARRMRAELTDRNF